MDELLVERHKLASILSKNNWKEWCEMMLRYHELSQEIYGKGEVGRKKVGWSIRDTSDSLKRSVASVQLDINLARALRDGKLQDCANREAAILEFKSKPVPSSSSEDD